MTRPRPESTNPIGLSALRERLAAMEHREAAGAPIPTGWTQADSALAAGGLARGALHDWIGLENSLSSRRWSPPLSVLLHLVSEAAACADRDESPLWLCWIGARVWPSASSLGRARHDLLSRSLFVEAGDAPERLWAADIAARSPSVLVVVDGSGFDMAASRRLQLAAEAGGAGGGWLVHLTRPPWEAHELSAAATRWSVAREGSRGEEPRFRVRCLRAKGSGSVNALDTSLVLERSDRDRLVVISTRTGNRSGAEAITPASAHADRPRSRRASA